MPAPESPHSGQIAPEDETDLAPHWVLVGLSGAGKSSLGKRLARRAGRDFRDSDRRVASLHGKPIHRIFAEDGEAEFRRAEREAVAELLQIRPAAVIALGGGAFLDPDNRAQVRQYGISVWIDLAPQIIAQRIGNVKTRPLLTQDPTPLDALVRLYEERKELYAQADHHFVAGHTSNTHTLDALEEIFMGQTSSVRAKSL